MAATKKSTILNPSFIKLHLDYSIKVPEESTQIEDKCINGSSSSRVDGIVLGVEVIVHDRWDQHVDHLGQVVLHQVDDFL